MMLLPSEHVYLSTTETALLLPAIKKVTARLASYNLGMSVHCFPYVGIQPERSAALYAGRKYDQGLAGEFQKMQNRLSALGRHGKLRLNVIHVTALAFAIRHDRDTQSEKRAETEVVEQHLENLRRRLKEAARRKDGGTWYSQFKARWDGFAQWMNFWVLFDRKHFPRVLLEKTSRGTHRYFRDQVKAWIADLIRERCENELGQDELLQLAYRVKRRARQRRFGRNGRGIGENLRVMLGNKERFNDEVFAYIQEHAHLTIKFDYLPPLLKRCLCSEKSLADWAKSTPGSGPVVDPILRAESAPTLSAQAVVTVSTAQSEPTLTISEHPRHKFIRLVRDFFLEEVHPADWFDIDHDVRRFPTRHLRKYHPAAGCMQPKQMLLWTRPDWEPENVPDQINWSVEYLLTWLGCYVHFSQIPDIVAAGCSQARQATNGKYMDNFRSLAYHN